MYAPNFLQAQLGPDKFNIFSHVCPNSERFGRQSCLQTSKLQFDAAAPPSLYSSDQKTTGATAIDFLVKVEVVKEILRTYVPCVLLSEWT